MKAAKNAYNIYCDESGHLQRMQQNVMVLGALHIPKNRVSDITNSLKQLKKKHGLNEHWELKWAKISNAKLDYYKGLIDYFMDEPDLSFRCIVIPDKETLDHKRFDRTDDDFYYVMFFYALKKLIENENIYDIYFDFKDAFQNEKLNVLKRYLQNHCNIADRNLRLHIIQSHVSQFIQFTDLLIGIVAYANKHLETNSAKLELVNYTHNRVRESLISSTVLHKKKFNVFVWSARK